VLKNWAIGSTVSTFLATASPCKFEESVTAALGEEGWNEFREKFFPAKAAEFMAKAEVPPFVYTSIDGEPLAKIQIGWKLKYASL
jgi:threonine synthase